MSNLLDQMRTHQQGYEKGYKAFEKLVWENQQDPHFWLILEAVKHYITQLETIHQERKPEAR